MKVQYWSTVEPCSTENWIQHMHVYLSGKNKHWSNGTLSNLLCQWSSLLFMISMQCWSVARIPAVVALKVIDSPLKSTPLAFAMESFAAELSKLSDVALLLLRLPITWLKVAGVGVVESSSISSSASWSTVNIEIQRDYNVTSICDIYM